MDKYLIPVERIQSRILLVRGQRVMLDVDLAEMYGVTTKRLNEQVKRNRRRFPKDFRFKLTMVEKAEVVANCDHLLRLKFSATLPYAFTEHGAIMAASVLNSSRAIGVSVFVVRAFVKLRGLLSAHKAIASKLAELEQMVAGHDQAIRSLFTAIQALMKPSRESVPPRIGFKLPPEASERKDAKEKLRGKQN